MSTRREIAEGIVSGCRSYKGGDLVKFEDAVGAIDKALRDRDERAAKIAETDDYKHSSGYRCYRGEVIAEKIRKDD